MSESSSVVLRPKLLLAMALAGGTLEAVQFFLPLWAGVRLQASPATVGGLLAVQTLASLIARSVAGRIADRGDRGILATTAAVLLMGAMVLYAVVSSVPLAIIAAVSTGVGTAFFMVPAYAHVADTGGSPRAYGRLLSFESRGSLVAFAFGFLLISRTTYSTLFLAAAVAFLAAAVCVVFARVPRGSVALTSVPHITRRLLPAAALIGITTMARSGIMLLILLHLQRHFALEPEEIGLVLAPGFLVFVLASGSTYRLTNRIGRRWTLLASLTSTGVMAVLLGFSSGIVPIGVGWALAAGCIAAAIPVEQSAIASISESNVGHGFGIQGMASLSGSIVGSAAFGALYGTAGWQSACLIVAVVVGVALPFVPWVVRTGSPAVVDRFRVRAESEVELGEP